MASAYICLLDQLLLPSECEGLETESDGTVGTSSHSGPQCISLGGSGGHGCGEELSAPQETLFLCSECSSLHTSRCGMVVQNAGILVRNRSTSKASLRTLSVNLQKRKSVQAAAQLEEHVSIYLRGLKLQIQFPFTIISSFQGISSAFFNM